MATDFRVGRGVQNDPKKLDIIGLKLSDMVGIGESKIIKNCQSFKDIPKGTKG